jgi:hypothetical protein
MLLQQEEENMGDVDLWALTDDAGSMTVNSRWLQHLQASDLHARPLARTHSLRPEPLRLRALP